MIDLSHTIKDWSESDMIEVLLKEPDDFLKVKETLTRIGIPTVHNSKQNLYQSCHILHKKGRYYIVHFKELYKLDGKDSVFTVDDRNRTRSISKLLDDWKLVELVEPMPTVGTLLNQIKIVSFKEKTKWCLRAKYTIGTRS